MEHRHYLHPLFEPTSVALIGATERQDAVGDAILSNLRGCGFRGEIFAVNPNRTEVHGLKAYPNVESLPHAPDLAVIATPAHTVPAIIASCGQTGVKAAVIYSGGFAEIGAEGEASQRALEHARATSDLRILGPNCLGLVRPAHRFDCSIGKGQVRRGNLALVSQSGTLCNAIIDWAHANRVGFSTVVTLGSSLDIDFGEVLDYLVHDDETDGILMYVEGIREARRFISALRAASKAKPVIAIKVGRQPAGAQAARSHTDAVVGDDEVFDAVLRRTGVVRVYSIPELFAAARTLTSRYRDCGERVAIVTNGGGPGALAADRAGDLGVPLAALGAATFRQLDEALPFDWSHTNPVDIIGDASPQRFRQSIEICLRDEAIDGVLAILTPQEMTDDLGFAKAVVELADTSRKPILCCLMGGASVAAGRQQLIEARIPVFQYPETLVGGYHFLLTHRRNRQLLLQIPSPTADRVQPDVVRARELLAEVRRDERDQLYQHEAKALLGCFHIPVPERAVACSPGEAAQKAEAVGFPVAMKVHSPDITHKSGVGGIALNLESAAAVAAQYGRMLDEVRSHEPNARIEGVLIERMVTKRAGRELMIGIRRDPCFGPVISLGSGGIWIEAYGRHRVSLPPLNEELARDLVDNAPVRHLLGRQRAFPAIDTDTLIQVLLRTSEIAEELPELASLEINPLIIDHIGAVAVDARATLRCDSPAPADPYAHLAITPYPKHLERAWNLKDGTPVKVRPIRPKDAEMEQAFVRNLSSRSRYLRFWSGMTELNRRMLAEFTKIDYNLKMTLVVTIGEGSNEQEIAVGQFNQTASGESCEFAIAVADAWQGKGLGSRLMRYLIEIAEQRGYRRIEGEVLSENRDMLGLMRALGFQTTYDPDDLSVRRVWKDLQPRPPTSQTC
ncbi:MAG: bifunctional acetate--CoA ligase family protein/GNAT family N-acetyltransferase [Pseudomonadota bacterium]|nr:bifunctional acetate--CoA ligase family protein/GNAT family N-acetyltransferase [Pseudomonadota bacterium]